MSLVRNVGRKDKNIRIAAGIVCLLIALLFVTGFKSIFWTALAAYLLASGVLSHCWIYGFMGKNTASELEASSASADLTERAVDNVGDFKERAGEVVEDIKESDLAQDAKEKFEDIK